MSTSDVALRPAAVPAVDATLDHTVVAFAGDWHGDGLWAIGRVMSAAEHGIKVIFHVGDFGLWPGPYGKRFLMQVEKACARYGVTIMVTPGNHEDWDRIDEKKAKDKGDGWGEVKHLTDHIKVHPRGHRFTMTTPSGNVRTFVSLGGAPSIDFETRTEGRDWWPSEMISKEDVDKVVKDGYADVMIAHDSPDVPYAVGAVAQILASNPQGWSQKGLSYAAMGRARMHRAYEGVKPLWFFHGHYHAPGLNKVSREGVLPERWVASLDMQRKGMNVATLDLDTLELV